MPRLYKFALIAFFAYALVTATPAQQTEIGRGLLAIKDAALDACMVEGRLCTRALTSISHSVWGKLSDEPTPWLDHGGKPQAQRQQSSSVQSP